MARLIADTDHKVVKVIANILCVLGVTNAVSTGATQETGTGIRQGLEKKNSIKSPTYPAV